MAELIGLLFGPGQNVLRTAMAILNIITKAQQGVEEITKTVGAVGPKGVAIKPVMIIDRGDKGDVKKVGLIVEGIEDDVETAVEVIARGLGIKFEKLEVIRK